ncbi:HNH endonuclease [Aeromonas cavernicola]|uniref:HNH endonuclease n=1 Tax=Aeromonas cavernicola TaxID=1006623 RepID=UPI0012FE3488|nr:HNH endonuclease [Aeromonas cavernicola]
MNCIICLDKNPITADNPLTDEHIVPEFIGGTLTAKNVCKICNSKFGHGFEGRLSNSFIFKISKQVYNISGKSKKTTSAFSGLYDHPSLGKIRVNDDNRVITLPSIDILEDDDGLDITLKIDKQDQHKAKSILAKKLQRVYAEKGKNYSDAQCSHAAGKILENAEKETFVTQPTLSGSFTVNRKDTLLLHLKISYELLVYHFGHNYIYDSVASNISESLFEQELKQELSFNFIENKVLEHLLDKDNVWVVISGNICNVMVFGFLSSLKFTETNSSFNTEEIILYKFDVKTGLHSMQTLA